MKSFIIEDDKLTQINDVIFVQDDALFKLTPSGDLEKFSDTIDKNKISKDILDYLPYFVNTKPTIYNVENLIFAGDILGFNGTDVYKTDMKPTTPHEINLVLTVFKTATHYDNKHERNDNYDNYKTIKQ